MKGSIALMIGIVLVLLMGSSAYTLNEVEQAVITQFGEPMGGAITDPGLHWKIPFIQKVNRFDKRWLEWDGSSEQVPTREKTYILVDTYARWRIVDPLKFFVSLRDERNAQSRLDDIIDNATRNVIAGHDLIEVVRTSNRPFTQGEADEARIKEPQNQTQIQHGRAKLARLILQKAQEPMGDFGIELVDVQFQRVNYSLQVQNKVFDRMISERRRIAELYRSEGEGERNIILGRKERELATIKSEAYRKVQDIEGSADAKATTIYAEAHRLDPGFYRLIESFASYKNSIDQGTLMVLSTEADYFEPLVKSTAR